MLVLATGCTAQDPPGSAGPAPATGSVGPARSSSAELRLQTYPVPAGAASARRRPRGRRWRVVHRPARRLPRPPEPGQTGEVTQVPLGDGSAPHGVIVGSDGAAWVTDGGLNAIVRVDAGTRAVDRFPLPRDRPNANLNTATFDGAGVLWFTGQAGIYGRLDPATREMRVFDAPQGRGPYGITTTPSGEVYYASLAGSHIARIDTATGAATVLQPPTAGPGRPAGVVGQPRPHLGQRVERRPGRPLRPGQRRVDRVAAAWGRGPGVLGLCRRPRPGLADRLHRERASSASTRPRRRSPPSRCPTPGPRSGRCSAGRARCGGRRRARTSW